MSEEQAENTIAMASDTTSSDESTAVTRDDFASSGDSAAPESAAPIPEGVFADTAPAPDEPPPLGEAEPQGSPALPSELIDGAVAADPPSAAPPGLLDTADSVAAPDASADSPQAEPPLSTADPVHTPEDTTSETSSTPAALADASPTPDATEPP